MTVTVWDQPGVTWDQPGGRWDDTATAAVPQRVYHVKPEIRAVAVPAESRLSRVEN